MANLRTAMDSAFWDQPVSTPLTLEGTANSVPGHPFPLDASRASRALRIQQLSLLGLGFPLGLIPSYSNIPQKKELGSFSIQSLLLKPSIANWWLGLVGQFRPKKLISNIRREISNADELEVSLFRDTTKHIFDKSLYSVAVCSQLALTPSCSLLWNTESHGERKGLRHKFMLYRKLPNHDITLEAGWPQLFIDHNGGYWDVPESISLNMSSIDSDSPLQYRFGLHKSSGCPQSVNVINGEAPEALRPGLCAKAAFSYEQSKDIWRVKETRQDYILKTKGGKFWLPAYDVRLKEPHATVSAVIGGTCEAWFGGRGNSKAIESLNGDTSMTTKKRSPLNAELFGSLCCTFQHGKFRKSFNDLTRVDARLDICSVSGFGKKVLNIFKTSSVSNADNSLSSPRLNLIFQQQIAGPIVFRVDSQFSLGSTLEKHAPHMEDLIYSLTYSLRLLHSGKVAAWYSPKRKEGMVELRLFEF